MKVLVDATTLISLGRLHELGLLATFDGDVRIPEAVAAEVSTEPAQHNLETFRDAHDARANPVDSEHLRAARSILGNDDDPHGEATSGDVRIVAGVLAVDRSIGVVSDDRRVRTTAEGLGATVTGTVGVVVRAVDEGPAADAGLSLKEGKALVRRLDDHGLHMTASLRETALRLVEEAAESRVD